MVELVSIVEAAGIEPSAINFMQVWQAVLALTSLTDTGTANALVATPPTGSTVGMEIEELVNGMELTIVAAASNTGASTFKLSGITRDIRRPDGSVLIEGDVVAGAPHRLYYDGNNGYWRLYLNASFTRLNSPLIGANQPPHSFNEVFLGSGLAMSGNVLHVVFPPS